MADKGYIMLQRLPFETDWQTSSRPPEERRRIEDAIEAAAKEARMFLCNRTPEAGWETKRHSRDGRWWPCSPMTQGARPAWIWAARK